MKRKRLIFYVAILCVLILSISIGVVGMTMQQQYKNNEITFVVDSQKAYSRIVGKYYHNNEEKTDVAYSEAFTEASEYAPNGTKSFPVWDIGISTFNGQTNPETFKYVVEITNLNNEYDLTARLNDVAVGEVINNNEKEINFYTTITYTLSGQSNVMFCNKEGQEVNYSLYTQGTSKVSITNPSQIAHNETLTITIEIERKTKINSFDVLNNFSINLDTVAK